MVKAVGGVAAFVGFLVRFVLWFIGQTWWALPMGLVVYGTALFDERLGWIVAGVLLYFVLLPDRRTK